MSLEPFSSDCSQRLQRTARAKLPSVVQASGSVRWQPLHHFALFIHLLEPGTTKKSLGTDASTSRISKLNLLRRHCQVLELNKSREGPCQGSAGRYISLKRSCDEYTKNRAVLFGAASPFHAWPVNDEALEDFTA